MISVLIVDDEKWICELINKSVSWNELGMQVAAIANNGMEALDAMQKHAVDVVITDIRMPGMDGITLIKKARENGLESRFIIISGYQDFEYAQKAIKYNVKNYLLKPIDEDELTLTLYKIREEIQDSRKKQERDIALETRLEESSSKLKEQFIRMIVKNGTTGSAFQNMDPKAEFGFDGDCYRCVIFRIDSATGGPCEKDVAALLTNRVVETVNKAMGAYCCSAFSFTDEYTISYIFNFNRGEDIKKHLKDCFVDLRLTVNTYRNYVLTMGVGSAVNDFGRLNHSYSEADIALKYRLIAGYNKMIESEYLKLDKSAAKDILTSAQRRKLINLILTANLDELNRWIESIFNFEDRQKINPVVLFDMAKSIFLCLGETLAETKYTLNEKELKSFFAEIECSISLEMFIAKIKNRLTGEIECWETEKQKEYSRPIATVKEFIGKNYDRDITLSEAADKVFLNPNYLSSLFKKETDMTFLEYLQKRRMEAAQDLLKDTGVKVSAIPGMVGYSDVKHFSKLFRKIVGLSPSEYRKLYT